MFNDRQTIIRIFDVDKTHIVVINLGNKIVIDNLIAENRFYLLYLLFYEMPFGSRDIRSR